MGTFSLRKSILLFIALILCHVSNAQRIVCDETCKLVDAPPASATVLPVRPAQTNLKKNQSDNPEPSKTENNGYAVVSPVGSVSEKSLRIGVLPRTEDESICFNHDSSCYSDSPCGGLYIEISSTEYAVES